MFIYKSRYYSIHLPRCPDQYFTTRIITKLPKMSKTSDGDSWGKTKTQQKERQQLSWLGVDGEGVGWIAICQAPEKLLLTCLIFFLVLTKYFAFKFRVPVSILTRFVLTKWKSTFKTLIGTGKNLQNHLIEGGIFFKMGCTQIDRVR